MIFQYTHQQVMDGSKTLTSRIVKPNDNALCIPDNSLIALEDVLPDCGFRMLEPRELKLGMSFPDEYIILGNKRDQVRQIGNAVCCNVAQAIAERVVESLAS